MIRRILTFKHYFTDFISDLDEKTRTKIKQGLLLLATQPRVSSKFVSHIDDGIYELRTLWDGNIYRTFFIFDEGNVVVLFNGFQKKTQKTPKKEIDKAKTIKIEYYASKQR